MKYWIHISLNSYRCRLRVKETRVVKRGYHSPRWLNHLYGLEHACSYYVANYTLALVIWFSERPNRYATQQGGTRVNSGHMGTHPQYITWGIPREKYPIAAFNVDRVDDHYPNIRQHTPAAFSFIMVKTHEENGIQPTVVTVRFTLLVVCGCSVEMTVVFQSSIFPSYIFDVHSGYYSSSPLHLCVYKTLEATARSTVHGIANLETNEPYESTLNETK